MSLSKKPPTQEQINAYPVARTIEISQIRENLSERIGAAFDPRHPKLLKLEVQGKITYPMFPVRIHQLKKTDK